MSSLFGSIVVRSACCALVAWAGWRDVEGRHYAFRGRRVEVVEDREVVFPARRERERYGIRVAERADDDGG